MDPQVSAIDLCEFNDLTFEEVAALLDSPEYASFKAFLQRLSIERTEIINHDATPSIHAALLTATRQPQTDLKSHESARKAASKLDAITHRKQTPQKQSSNASTDTTNLPPTEPKPAPEPDCTGTSEIPIPTTSPRPRWKTRKRLHQKLKASKHANTQKTRSKRTTNKTKSTKYSPEIQHHSRNSNLKSMQRSSPRGPAQRYRQSEPRITALVLQHLHAVHPDRKEPEKCDRHDYKQSAVSEQAKSPRLICMQLHSLLCHVMHMRYIHIEARAYDAHIQCRLHLAKNNSVKYRDARALKHNDLVASPPIGQSDYHH